MKFPCFHIRLVLRACLAAVFVPACFGLDPGKAISQYHQDFWTEEDGLPQASVQAITQTRNGYLWIGTRDGLARFDGLKFTVYRGDEHPGLLSDDIRSLHEDNLGRLWIGTFNGGVSCLENGSFRAYSTRDGLTTSGVLEIYQDSYGHLWFGTWGGVARFNRGRFEFYRGGEDVVGRNGWSFSEDATGQLWMATDRAIHQYSETGFQVDRNLPGVPCEDIRKLHIAKDGVLWVGTLNGLVRCERGIARRFTRANGLADNRVRSIAEDEQGNIWVGTWDGLSRIQADQATSLPKAERISGMIEALYLDRDGSLWIGMRGGGLGRLRDASFSNITLREGLPSTLPRCVFEAKDGAVWIGTDGGGLARFVDGKRELHLKKGSGLPTDFVASVAEDQSGTIWAGLGRPAAIARIEGGVATTIWGAAEGLPFEYSVRAVFVDREGRVWAGGDGGLCLIENDQIAIVSGLPIGPVRMIAQDQAGQIWVGSNGGLCIIADGAVQRVYTTADGLTHNAIYSFYESVDGTIWLGSQQGLTQYQNGCFRSLERSRGGFHGTIYGVLEDGHETIWMSSSRGISAVRRLFLEQALADSAKSVAPLTFGTADGLKSTQCQGGSLSPVCKTRDGKLWFATLNGVAVTQPSEPDLHQHPPSVLIEQMRADRKDGDPTIPGKFSAGTEDFEFTYTALKFITPEKVQFRYQLVGHDRDWVPAGTRRAAYYNNLRPGSFTFRVSASSDGVTWSEPAETAVFSLLPHFYQTPWFYLTCAGTVLAFGWSIHRSRMRKAREQFALVLAERTRIARDLHDTLAQGFAGTAFQLEALRSTLRSAPPEIKKHLDLALTMVRHSFAEAKRTVLNLRSPELEGADLRTAVSHVAEQMLANTGVELRIHVDGKAAALGREAETELLRICQEALANVLKHARASQIELNLDFTGGRCPLLVIRDDGVGFDPEAVEKPNGYHFGLLGMRERVKQIGGRLQIRSAAGAGTELSVYLN